MSDTGQQQREVDYFVDILRGAISARPGDYLFRRDVYERTRSALVQKASARGMSDAVVARMSASLGLAREIVEAAPDAMPVIEDRRATGSDVDPSIVEPHVVEEPTVVVPDGQAGPVSIETTVRIEANDHASVETAGWAPSSPVESLDRKVPSTGFGDAFVAEFDRIAGEPVEVLRREIESVYPERRDRGSAEGRGLVSMLLSRLVPSRRQRAPEGAAS